MAKKTTGPQNARQAKIEAARQNTNGATNKIIVGAVVAVVAIIAVAPLNRPNGGRNSVGAVPVVVAICSCVRFSCACASPAWARPRSG